MTTLSGMSPAAGESLVDPSSTIEFALVDGGAGIDISTLIVILKGDRAVDGAVFDADFDGPLSSITPSGADFFVTIDPLTPFGIGKAYEVQIQVQDLNGSYLNRNYAFKTIPEEPILVSSSPLNNQTLLSPQLLYLEFDDIIDGVDPLTVNVDINNLDYIINGVAVGTENGALTDVRTNGTTAIEVRIDPIEALINGPYILRYSVSDNLGNTLRDDIVFDVNLKENIMPSSVFAQTGFLGFFQGIKRVSDIGCGDTLHLEWNTPVRKIYKNELFVVVYENEYRLNVFDKPTYLAVAGTQDANVRGLTTGVTLSYGARALELADGLLDPTGMEVVDSGFFRVPDNVLVTATLGPSDLVLRVNSTEGFPDAGLLLLGREAIRYTAVDRVNNTFSIPSNGRGLLNSTPGIYMSGDEVELFLKCSDDNTVIVMSTPTYHDGYGPGRFINGEGLVVTDYSDNDRQVFDGFDFCGWRDERPIDALTGSSGCGSYLGGENDGFRGMDLYNRMLGREEILLNTTGEPVILLKRIWDGDTCSCVDSRSSDAKMRSCQSCYGTGYEEGFLQFYNPRREDRRITVSFNESPEDLFRGEKEGLQQEYEPNAWTLAIPAIRDRDVLVRFDRTNDLEFYYEVQNVAREKIFDRRSGRQTLVLKRLDKTDIMMTFPVDLSNLPLIP